MWYPASLYDEVRAKNLKLIDVMVYQVVALLNERSRGRVVCQ